MNFLSLFKSSLSSLIFAVGQVFTWLNRRAKRKKENERKDRIADNMAAAARPNQQSADRLNRWLARGRSGRLRNRSRES